MVSEISRSAAGPAASAPAELTVAAIQKDKCPKIVRMVSSP
jgi:hypothetical protein